VNKYTCLFLLVTVIACACKKTLTTTSQNPLLGSWRFSKAYTMWNFYEPTDSVYISFDGSNNYEFRSRNLPVDNGTYAISPDSLVALNPADTAYSSFYSLTHLTMSYNYASRSSFASDKYYFSKPGPDELTIRRVWSLPNNPYYFYVESYDFEKR